MKISKRVTAAILTAALCAVTGIGCSSGSDPDKTAIEVFVFKPESVEIFQELGAKFEKENPDIKVYVNSPGDAYAILKARMVKGNPPKRTWITQRQIFMKT